MRKLCCTLGESADPAVTRLDQLVAVAASSARASIHSGRRRWVAPLEESLTIYRELGNASAIIYLVEDHAGVAAADGRAERALRLAGFAEARRKVLGTPLAPAEADRVERMVAPARDGLDAAAAERAHAEGRALGLADALDAVLSSS